MFPRSRREFVPFVRSHWRSLLLLLLGVMVPFVLFTHLTHEVFREGGFAWDQAILNWYAQRRTPGLTRFAELLAVLGGVTVLPFVVLAIAWLLGRAQGKAHGWFLLTAVAGATLLNVVAKVVFQRPRPDELVAVLTEPGFSFPSGHAMANAAFGFALTLVFWRSRAGWPVAVFGVLWALAIGVSRNYLGVHYPSDVLAGFTASVTWVAGLYILMARRWPQLRKSPGGEGDTRPPVTGETGAS
ncbi:phosphatase PAP2 family protein [Deinococcus daejeonensis]|uniref:Phosphatidylglycerophosphatase n=1 Tax=Deinococcus daejeonensis TaxID=1007098 RepID=A0ABQ2IRR9_9DEIO|nr:phosphatase PAP2 family protein [Deinococcus daejeonensis]GGN28452.1 phosphatidylglycerophosphatase [Deinococcus daejeonensis]